MNKFPLDPKIIANEIEIPLDEWPGNCHVIASNILKKMPIQGMRLCRGHWTGYINKESVYRTSFIQQHSWLELEDGRILDPTRWAITSPKIPSIYIGLNDNYDEFGLMTKKKNYMPTLGKVEYPYIKNLKAMSNEDFKLIFSDTQRPDTERGWETISYQFDILLKSEPWTIDNVEEVYSVIERNNLKAWVQIDMWNSVMEQEKTHCNPFANYYYDPPKLLEITETEKLFKILNNFLCIEDRENIEQELEEIGYSMESDLWDNMNYMESIIKSNPEIEIENLPNIDGMIDTLSVIAGELLGKGYGKELQVERYARSLGIINKRELSDMLEAFGNRCSYDLRWY